MTYYNISRHKKQSPIFSLENTCSEKPKGRGQIEFPADLVTFTEEILKENFIFVLDRVLNIMCDRKEKKLFYKYTDLIV